MKKIYVSILCLNFVIAAQAQTVVWSSDFEDFTGFSLEDKDGDGANWNDGDAEPAGPLSDLGFSEGKVYGSVSSNRTPDNIMMTPSDIVIPATAEEITFKMKVGAVSATKFAEKFAIYVYDATLPATYLDTMILEETLTSGGPSTAKDIIATIPVSFAGKTVGFAIRHYQCPDQFVLIIDDLEVSYSETLGIADYENGSNSTSFFPNPVKDMLNFDTEKSIASILVYNQIGQEVMRVEETEIVNNIVDLSDLSQGIYLINFTSDTVQETFTIVKE